MRFLLSCLVLFAASIAFPAEPAAQPTGLKLFVAPSLQYAHDDIWNRTPGDSGPSWKIVGNVVRQQPVCILVFANQFAVNADHRAEVQYRLTFIRPDGSTGNSADKLRLVQANRRVDQPDLVHKAAETATFVATEKDPLGEWRVVVEATDLTSHLTVREEQHFSVVADTLLAEPLPAEVNPGTWLLRYHAAPVPQQLFAACRALAENPATGSAAKHNGAWLGGFEQIISDNPWLLAHVLTRLGQAGGPERDLLATSLAFAKRNDPAFFKNANPAVRQLLAPFRKENWPEPSAEPLSGDQLDVLWGRFFASGRYAPVRTLVGVLAYHPFKDAVDEYQKLTTKPAIRPVEVDKSAVFRAAVWSLESNVRQDPLLRDYCAGIVQRHELPEKEQAWLVEILRRAAQNPPAAPTSAPATGS